MNTVYVVITDWRDRQYEPEIVGVFEDEVCANDTIEAKECELQNEGYDVEEEVCVYYEKIILNKAYKS